MKPILIAALLALCSCSAKVEIESTQLAPSPITPKKSQYADYAATNLPPGWALMCSDDGLYAVKSINRDLVYTASPLVSKDRAEAAYNAWLFYEDERAPRKRIRDVEMIQRDWKECDK